MPEPEPFPLSPELRLQTVEAVGKLLASDVPAYVLKAAEIILVMDQLNLRAEQSQSYSPQPSKN